MSSPFITTAIRDVAPTLSEPYPQDLKRLIDNLYNSSKHKISLKQNEEIARYHICAIMAVNRLKNEKGFLDPVLDNSPVPTKVVLNLLKLFDANLQGSSINTPVSTPQKRRIVDRDPKTGTPSPSPAKKRGRPPSAIKLPLTEQLEAARSAGSKTTTPLNSPSKPLQSTTSKTPSKSTMNSPFKNPPASSYSSPSKHLRLLSASEITALCNKFQLETDVVQNVLETFKQYCNKVSNEWILLCGLIINCYFVINHTVISEKVGSKTNVIKTMFSLQNGGLMLDEVNTSISIVQNLIAHNKWFKQLKIRNGFKIEEQTIASTSGNMISKDVQFHSESAQLAQKEWLEKVKHELLSGTT